MAKFYIVGEYPQIKSMMLDNGWKESTNMERLDRSTLIIFGGGEDVHPSLYGEVKHPSTVSNLGRDIREAQIYKKFIGNPKVGICRGFQFLSVMNGCSLLQHVNGHSGNHEAIFSSKDGEDLSVEIVTSTHHQMVLEPDENRVEHNLLAYSEEATVKEGMFYEDIYKWEDSRIQVSVDVEAMHFPRSNTMGFQFHPEYSAGGMRDMFFKIIKERFGIQGGKIKDYDKPY